MQNPWVTVNLPKFFNLPTSARNLLSGAEARKFRDEVKSGNLIWHNGIWKPKSVVSSIRGAPIRSYTIKDFIENSSSGNVLHRTERVAELADSRFIRFWGNSILIGTPSSEDSSKTHHQYILLQDIRKLSKINDWDLETSLQQALTFGDIKASCTCFGGDTLVTTPNGCVPIRNIQAGDFVLSGDGVFRKVLQKHENGVKSVIPVKFKSETIWSTPSHDWYLRSAGYRDGRTSRASYSEIGKRASSQVMVNSPQFGFGTESVDKSFAFMLGLFLSDGCMQSRPCDSRKAGNDHFWENRIWSGLNFSADAVYETEYRELFIRLGFDIDLIKICRSSNSRTISWDFWGHTSKSKTDLTRIPKHLELFRFIWKYARPAIGGGTSQKVPKQLFSSVFNWDKESALALLQGFFWGDGIIELSTREGFSKARFANTNLPILEQLSVLMSGFSWGNIRRVSKGGVAPWDGLFRKPSYVLSLDATATAIFINSFPEVLRIKNRPENRHRQKIGKDLFHQDWHLDVDGYWLNLDARKNSNLLDSSQEMEVFDLAIEGNPSYCVGRSRIHVHNCPAWGYWGSKFRGSEEGYQYGAERERRRPTRNARGLVYTACFAGDTLISTKTGMVPIKDIQVGDEVLSGDGVFRKVTYKHENGKNVLYPISHMKEVIWSTKNHSWFSRKRMGSNKLPEYVPIGEFFSATNSRFVHSPRWKPGTESVDLSLAFILGLFLSDGTMPSQTAPKLPGAHGSTMQLWNGRYWGSPIFYSDSRQKLEYEQLFSRLGFAPEDYTYSENSSSFTCSYTFSAFGGKFRKGGISLRNQKLYEFLWKYSRPTFNFESGTQEKVLLPGVFDWNSQSVLALLQGFFWGDGTIDLSSAQGSRALFTNTNVVILDQLAVLASCLYWGKVRLLNSAGFRQSDGVWRKDGWVLAFDAAASGKFLGSFPEVLQIKSKPENRFRQNINPDAKSQMHEDADGYWHSLNVSRKNSVSILAGSKVEESFDLEIEGNPSYCVGRTRVHVHNCKHVAVALIWIMENQDKLENIILEYYERIGFQRKQYMKDWRAKNKASKPDPLQSLDENMDMSPISASDEELGVESIEPTQKSPEDIVNSPLFKDGEGSFEDQQGLIETSDLTPEMIEKAKAQVLDVNLLDILDDIETGKINLEEDDEDDDDFIPF